MAARLATLAAAAVLQAVWVPESAGLPPEVAPRCSRPFAPPAPSCFCSRASNGDWAVTCGCPDRTFPAGQTVVLTPKLLPPAADADGLILAVLGCRRPVRLSRQLLDAAETRFASITVEVSDTERLLLPEPPAAAPQAPRYNSVTALLNNVSVPRLTGALFSNRLAVRANFTCVNISEIAAGAFRLSLLAPDVRIVDSRVGLIASGAFDLPVGAMSSKVPLTGLRIVRSQVEEWGSGGHVGGALLHVLDSNIARLKTGALSTTGLVQLHWNGSSVEGIEPAAVYQHLPPPQDVLPPAVLGFFNNTFRTVTADNDSRGPLHFQHGVPSALEFIDNDVYGAATAPVTPEPRPAQVAGTRLECRCPLLAPWLAGSGAFRSVSQCLTGGAASLYQAECEAGAPPEPADNRRETPPGSSSARLAVAVTLLAAGLLSSSRTLAGW